ncbi:guanine nucleotide-binding protein subunit alpha [Lobulomyces angularis]|nr:guanine nucleotide-binding protein subunit alpha [Lobulomyces angularis]
MEQYKPSDQDILCCRRVTKSITETKIVVGKQKLRIFDFGGQKHLRNFWAPYFDDKNNSIIFVTAISSFDQKMEEDEENNRFEDSLKLFEILINKDVLQKVEFILFFNKMDLLIEKLKVKKLKDYITDFEGDQNDLKVTKRFFRKKFESVSQKPLKYVHFTSCTDSKLMKKIIKDVLEIIISGCLDDIGLTE